MDIFDLIGPVMVGPSSSHTAGAARIGFVSRMLLGGEIARAKILLHGSFAETGRGHGTDRAIVAGLLGMREDDERIPNSFELAKERGLDFEIQSTTLRAAHPNSAKLELWGAGGAHIELIAASVGGGRIEIRELDGMALSFSAEKPTIIVSNEDQPGSVADVSQVLACEGINIATFQVSRNSRGGKAVMIIECDAAVSGRTMAHIRALPGILKAVYINASVEEGL